MRYKVSMPRDVRALVLAHVRGYERRREALRQARSGAITDRPEPAAAGGGGRKSRRGSDTERRALELDRLTRCADGASVRAVEAALSAVGEDIEDAEVRRKLRDAVLLSCRCGRGFPYERMNVPTVGRDDFYRRRNAFLADVAWELGYL